MEILTQAIDIFLHLDKHLTELFAEYGTWVYAILFLIIFVETGLVVMPFLPGDSLLFAAGALVATSNGTLNIGFLFVLLSVAAIIGDALNYSIGNYIGPKAFSGQIKWLRKDHLEKTHGFYEKHGGKTIIIARFIPIIRTFAPFVAGIGAMTYRKFFSYNVVGAIAWVGSFLLLGYFFAELPIVKKNFTLVIMGIIVLSLLPPIIEIWKAKRQKAA